MARSTCHWPSTWLPANPIQRSAKRDPAKAAGYGLDGGVFQASYSEPIVKDLIGQKTGEVIPRRHKVQISPIPELTHDWPAIVDSAGRQLTVAYSHWPMLCALNDEERNMLTKTSCAWVTTARRLKR